MARNPKAGTATATPTIVPRAEHGISRAAVNENALKVLYRLKQADYAAYLVGGCVRDLLLGHVPKDFDIATDARPEEIKTLFRNSRLIGRRFRLAHVRFGREVIEVATFRAANDQESLGDEVQARRIESDNIYGTMEEDAWRRDFTVNALFYNIRDFSVVDYTGGLRDLREGVLRLIGEPRIRYHEDPVRMLRAVRFAAKLGMRIHPDTAAPIRELAHLLHDIPPARLYEEVLKLFLSGQALETFRLMRHYALFGALFPQTEAFLDSGDGGRALTMLERGLHNTDTRLSQGKTVNPAFLFALLLWEPCRQLSVSMQAQGASEFQAIQHASREVLGLQLRHVALPRRFSLPMREIWSLQPRFQHRTGKRSMRLLAHPRFRASYDFLLLRGESSEPVQELCEWWTEFQTARDENGRNQLLDQAAVTRPRRRRRKSRRSKTAKVSV